MPMTDRRLAQLARKYKTTHDAQKTAESDKKDFAEPIITELSRRGTRSLETNGVKVTAVYPEETRYDWATLKEALSPKLLRSIQVEAVDKQKLAEAVQDGKIDTAVVAAATEVTPKSPYITVTIQERR